MRTITVASAKGGSGKTTTVATLAERAAQESGRVCMIDMNEDQGTLTEWWQLRGRPINPYLLPNPGNVEADLKALADAGVEIAFIDTPPMEMDVIEVTVALSDAVIIPVMPSFFDTRAVDEVIDMCQRRKRPYAFLFSAYDARKAFDQVNADALSALHGRGTLLKHHISYSPSYRLAQAEGRTGPEMDKKLKGEVDGIWAEVRQLAGMDAKVVTMPRGRLIRGK